MPSLSPAGNQLVQQLAQRHGLSTDAVTHMLIAVHNGNGSMAQFNHPEFSGAGQWMRGGMTMVSDLFNNQLKYRVESICNDIANELANYQQTPFSGSFQSQSQNGMHSQSQAAGGLGSVNSLFAPDPTANWWPQELEAPSALGAQNNVRYAYFPQSRRLAVKTGNDMWVYDTLQHQIGGFSQQQGSNDGIAFSSQFGTISLSSLPIVSRNGVAAQQPHNPPVTTPVAAPAQASTSFAANGSSTEHASFSAAPSPAPLAPDVPQPATTISSGSVGGSAAAGSAQLNRQEILETLDQLGGLLKKGYLTEAEFAAKKADLLSRL